MQIHDIGASDVFSIAIPAVRSLDCQNKSKAEVENILHDFALVLDDSSLEVDSEDSDASTSGLSEPRAFHFEPPWRIAPTDLVDDDERDTDQVAASNADAKSDADANACTDGSGCDTESLDAGQDQSALDQEDDEAWYRAIAIRAEQLSSVTKT